MTGISTAQCTTWNEHSRKLQHEVWITRWSKSTDNTGDRWWSQVIFWDGYGWVKMGWDRLGPAGRHECGSAVRIKSRTERTVSRKIWAGCSTKKAKETALPHQFTAAKKTLEVQPSFTLYLDGVMVLAFFGVSGDTIGLRMFALFALFTWDVVLAFLLGDAAAAPTFFRLVKKENRSICQKPRNFSSYRKRSPTLAKVLLVPTSKTCVRIKSRSQKIGLSNTEKSKNTFRLQLTGTKRGKQWDWEAWSSTWFSPSILSYPQPGQQCRHLLPLLHPHICPGPAKPGDIKDWWQQLLTGCKIINKYQHYIGSKTTPCNHQQTVSLKEFQ